jgi:hypothetical protein
MTAANHVATPDTIQAVHPTVLAFMTCRQIEAGSLRRDGRLSLHFDDIHRVHICPSPHERIALTASLLALGAMPSEQAVEQLLSTLTRKATGMLQKHPSTLCIDPRGQSLQLQQVLESDINVEELENALAEFVNALAFWRETVAVNKGS